MICKWESYFSEWSHEKRHNEVKKCEPFSPSLFLLWCVHPTDEIRAGPARSAPISEMNLNLISRTNSSGIFYIRKGIDLVFGEVCGSLNLFCGLDDLALITLRTYIHEEKVIIIFTNNLHVIQQRMRTWVKLWNEKLTEKTVGEKWEWENEMEQKYGITELRSDNHPYYNKIDLCLHLFQFTNTNIHN